MGHLLDTEGVLHAPEGDLAHKDEMISSSTKQDEQDPLHDNLTRDAAGILHPWTEVDSDINGAGFRAFKLAPCLLKRVVGAYRDRRPQDWGVKRHFSPIATNKHQCRNHNGILIAYPQHAHNKDR